MLQIIIVAASLAAAVLGFIVCRRWLLSRIAHRRGELTQLEQEMDAAEYEIIKHSDLRLKLNNAIASLNYADLTAKRVEECLTKECDIPVPALPISDEQSKVAMSYLAEVMDSLNKHSIEIAGIEQILLNMLNTPKSGVFGQLFLSYFAGLLPQNLQASAMDVIQRMANGHIDNIDSLHSVASEVVNNAIHLYETNPLEIVSLVEHLAPGQSLWTHLLDSPHIGVYAQGLTSLSEHIVSNHDAAFNAVDHYQHVQHAGIGADHLGHIGGFDAHFPFITAAISLSREIALLKESKTTLRTSVEHVTLDVLGTGTGGTIGGTIGTFLIPVPVLGTILGSVTGGMLGRFLTNQVKEKPYKEARKELEAAVNMLEKEETTAAQKTIKKVNAVASEKKWQFANQVASMPKVDEGVRRQLIGDVENLRLRASLYLKHARTLVVDVNNYAGKRWYRGLLNLLVPGLPQLATQLVLVEERVRNVECILPTEALVHSNPVAALEHLSRLSVPLSTYMVRVEQTTKNVLEVTDNYRREVMEWSHKATSTYVPLANTLKPVIEAECEDYKRTCEKFIKKVNEATTKVTAEAQALGLV